MRRWPGGEGVGELGMDGAFREIGCSEDRTLAALRLNTERRFELEFFKRKNNVSEAGRPRRSTSDGLDLTEEGHFDSNDLNAEAYTELEISTVVATVGRGISPVKVVYCWMRKENFLTENDATALFGNLTANTNIEELEGVGRSALGTRKKCTLLGNAYSTNSNLRKLTLSGVGMGSESMRYLMDGLQISRALEVLNLSLNPLKNEGKRLVAEFLAANATLKRLEPSGTRCELDGAAYNKCPLHLARNITLQELAFGILLNKDESFGVGVFESYNVLLELLSRYVGHAPPKDNTLQELELDLPRILWMAWRFEPRSGVGSGRE